MGVKLLYFASLREALGLAEESIELPPGVETVGALRAWLAKRHAPLATTKNLRAAVNQRMAGLDAPVRDGDEVAFFPPVTGG